MVEIIKERPLQNQKLRTEAGLVPNRFAGERPDTRRSELTEADLAFERSFAVWERAYQIRME